MDNPIFGIYLGIEQTECAKKGSLKVLADIWGEKLI